MTEYTMTYRQAVKAGACPEGLSWVGEAVGGWDAYGKDTPVPLTFVLDMEDDDEPDAGYEITLWALDHVDSVAYDLVWDDMCYMWGEYTAGYDRLMAQRHAHLRMVLAGRIRPGYWRASNGWCS